MRPHPEPRKEDHTERKPVVQESEEELKKLPSKPGVYLMHDERDAIIYVGKAKKLKNRVTSYFRGVERHLPKVYRMLHRLLYHHGGHKRPDVFIPVIGLLHRQLDAEDRRAAQKSQYPAHGAGGLPDDG